MTRNPDWPIGQSGRNAIEDIAGQHIAHAKGGVDAAPPVGFFMRVLFVHPSPLMYSEIYLRLEPLGMERVAAATRAAGHDVRVLDLQIFRRRDYLRELDAFRPAAVGFSLNYLANVPEALDL